jgi:hypothetical protein
MWGFLTYNFWEKRYYNYREIIKEENIMKTYNIYDSNDNEFKRGFIVQAENRKEAKKKAIEMGACKFYQIENPVAYTPEEVDYILNGGH